MFKNGLISCCPLCKNSDSTHDTIIGLSKEFGVPFFTCDICHQSSARDLTHGIKNDAILSNRRRNCVYSEEIKKLYSEKSILEIGPGDYGLSNTLAASSDVTTIDVGINFSAKVRGDIENWSVPIPEDPKEIFDISKKMYTKIKEVITEKFDLGVSLHSLEHSPDPITMIKIFDDLCEDFVIEVPDGRALHGPNSSVLDQTVCPVDWSDKLFPILSGPRGRSKGNLVGGHYQVFNSDSLAWICHNVLKKGRTYYIGTPLGSGLGIVLTTDKHFTSQCLLVIEK